MNDITAIKLFLLDIDGTVYIDGKPIGAMADTLEKIRRSGRKLIFLTNNSSRTAADYVARLSASGLFGKGDEVYTSGDATIAYIKRNFPGKSVALIGTKALKADFIASGIELSDSADLLVLAYDTEIDYNKLCIAAKHLLDGKPYIATHPDVTCPAKDCYIPDAGSFIALLESSTGRQPDTIIGKPYNIMGDEIMKKTGLKAEEIMMVGDRLYTDIKFAVNNRFKSLLVFSGETDKAAYAASDTVATMTLEDLNDIVGLL